MRGKSIHLRIGKQIIYEEHENNYVQMTMFSYKVMPAAFLTCMHSIIYEIKPLFEKKTLPLETLCQEFG